MGIDYSIFYKKKYPSIEEFVSDNYWDLYISAYNDSERVKKPFSNVNCGKKHWLILPEYNYTQVEFPNDGEVFDLSSYDSESEMIVEYFHQFDNLNKLGNICVDITGFMRPQLIFLIRYLYDKKVQKFDIVYTDPNSYAEKEKTTFTKDPVYEIRQIEACEGNHTPDTSNDILIIGSGYDHKLIHSVSEEKENARKIQIFGFPSLQPDMYQENILRAYKAEEAIGGRHFLESQNSLYAPANDPFITAKVIHDFVEVENRYKIITNLYLSPLSTKAQTLGFALYYVMERINKATSIIFPFCSHYTRETSIGISKIWKYTIEFI